MNNAYYITDIYENQDLLIPEGLYRYEITTTFNPRFYPLGKACDYIRIVIREIINSSSRFISAENKKLFREYGDNNRFLKNHYLEYSVEYHKNGYPHIHAILHTEVDISAEKLFRFQQTLRKKFGKSDIYYTDTEDRIHENDHFVGKWSEYLKKEVEQNEVNGKRHYFKIKM